MAKILIYIECDKRCQYVVMSHLALLDVTKAGYGFKAQETVDVSRDG
jgi:hypothetical protein